MRLPMFPLGSVLMPGQVLPLHIFEPRYRALLSHCLEGEREFGVVLIERGSEVGGGDVRSAIGTVARILQAEEIQPEHWAVVTVGTRRIRVDRWAPDDPYPLAEVTDVVDTDPDSDRDPAVLADWSAVQNRFRGVEELAAALGAEIPDGGAQFAPDPVVGTLHIAALSPIGPFDQQVVLSTTSVAERVAVVGRLLEEVADTLRALRDDGGGPSPDLN